MIGLLEFSGGVFVTFAGIDAGGLQGALLWIAGIALIWDGYTRAARFVRAL